MERQEILAKSRKENEVQDERELVIRHIAWYIAKAVGGVVCMLISLIITIFFDKLGIVSSACFMVYTCMAAVEYWISAYHLRDRKGILAAAVFYTVIFLLLTVFFVVEMVVWKTN